MINEKVKKGRRPVAIVRGLRSVLKDARSTPAQKLQAAQMLGELEGFFTPILDRNRSTVTKQVPALTPDVDDEYLEQLVAGLGKGA